MITNYGTPTAGDYADWLVKESEKKANHRAPIVQIGDVRPIEGADRIEQVFVGAFDAFSFVSQKGTFKVGDLAVFIQPDSIVPATEQFSYLWADYAAKYPGAEIPASQRRVTVRRFKKVWSEGLLVPLAEAFDNGRYYGVVTEGQDMSDMLGITHYEADEITGDERVKTEEVEFMPKGKKRKPTTLKGWFFYLLHKLHVKRNEKFLRGPYLNLPVYDVENFKNYSRTFVDGEDVVVTEKIHGSSARFVCVDGVMYAGSRKQWVSPAGSSYPAEALRNNLWIEEWCRRNEGYALYGEVTPRQKGYKYDADASSRGARFWLFDIRTPDGRWLDYDDILYLTLPQNIDMVPVLYRGGYDKALIDLLVDGPTTVREASHIREGIVIKTARTDHRRGVGRAQLKIVSNVFLDKDKKLTAGV